MFLNYIDKNDNGIKLVQGKVREWVSVGLINKKLTMVKKAS